jgi:hypothetical protein
LADQAVSGGRFLPEPGLCNTKWPGQATRAAVHVDPVERDAGMRIIEGPAGTIADLRWTIDLVRLSR